MIKRILSVLIVLLVPFILIEACLHILIKPSEKSYGSLFNLELPPLKIIPHDLLKNENLPFKVGKSREREDELMGFTIKENYTSPDGSYKSNNFGARSNKPITSKKIPGYERILVFGDSATMGDYIKQNETFEFLLNKWKQNVEFINFGVGGYNMGQSYLHFKTLKDKLQFDGVYLVFSPRDDLWRDINVSRFMVNGWDSHWSLLMLPRFVIERGSLKLIPPPYKTIKELVNDNKDFISPKLTDHLRKYDTFYSDCMYDESNSIFDKLLIYKLLKRQYCKTFKQTHNYDLKLMDANSEAMKVTKGIIDTMAHEVNSNGAKFSLIILPSKLEVKYYRQNLNFKKSWDAMASYLCIGGINCYDLMGDLQQIRYDSLDFARDGSHYGPQSNKFIAEFILNKAF